MLATHPTTGATTRRRAQSHARFKFPQNPSLFPFKWMDE